MGAESLRGKAKSPGATRDEKKGVGMSRYVLGLEEIDETQAAQVGGKGANLGELSRIEGIRVPGGFCVTTDAHRKVTQVAPSLDDLLNRLSGLKSVGGAHWALRGARIHVEGLDPSPFSEQRSVTRISDADTESAG
jgi:hypothetical protein